MHSSDDRGAGLGDAYSTGESPSHGTGPAGHPAGGPGRRGRRVLVVSGVLAAAVIVGIGAILGSAHGVTVAGTPLAASPVNPGRVSTTQPTPPTPGTTQPTPPASGTTQPASPTPGATHPAPPGSGTTQPVPSAPGGSTGRSPRGGPSPGGTAGPGSGGGAGGGAARVGSATAAQQVGVVDIDTVLGYDAAAAAGTGMVLTPAGVILTNNHVVEGATEITVQFGADDLTATVVGTDPQTDIAVIRIQKTGLPAATIGSSTDLKVGETVIAIGSPFGLDKTVTSGIVSALHRSDLISGASGISSYTNLIQTDAAINPGNSGGALADLSGAVVGMNTLIQSPSGTLGAAQSAGIGFAIPIDFAKSTADTLISGKKVTHPYLGASTLTITAEMSYYYGLPVSAGAYVQEVANGSPADKAGIQVDDIITRFGTSDITSVEDLFVAVNESKLGVAVPVEFDRSGQTMTVDVKLVAQ